jgi:uncharacterized YigZ family protein
MILTLVGRSDAMLKVRDSRFIGIALPAESEPEAREGISSVERQHPDAAHCCYAYRLGTGDGTLERTSDAGEPAGSAGAPILSVIRGRNLANVAVAVVRYFGGTKLGVGGLVRAYRDAARAALDSGTVLEREVRRRVGVALPLTLVGEARSLLARFGGEVISERYGESAELLVSIGEGVAADFRSRVDDLSRGAARWSPGSGREGEP